MNSDIKVVAQVTRGFVIQFCVRRAVCCPVQYLKFVDCPSGARFVPRLEISVEPRVFCCAYFCCEPCVQTNRVAPATEEVYDDAFWESLDSASPSDLSTSSCVLCFSCLLGRSLLCAF
jgi:hypothetical protein